MKKLFLLLITVVLLLLLLSACTNISNDPESATSASTPQETVLPEKTEQADEVMNERLITADELLEYIQTHDVGLTSNDFIGVDIEDFISRVHFTSSNINQLNIKILESYLTLLVSDERAGYMATEKYSVESTDEEYEKFIEDFFKEINKEILSSTKAHSFYRYDIIDDGKRILYIAQTKDIEEFSFFDGRSSYPELLEVSIEDGPDGAGTIGNLCYSKNKKYVMLANPFDDQLFEYTKVFCEIDD